MSQIQIQAVIGFELEESSGLHEIEYDTVKMPFVDGAFTPGQDGKWQQPEEGAFANKQPCPWTGDIWVFLVKENGDTKKYAYPGYPDITVRGLPRVDPDYVIVFTDGTAGHTELAVAHELGHLLFLSAKDDDGSGHDGGPWPQGQESLMRSGTPTGPPGSPTLPEPGRWLRHEDWSRANVFAGEKYED